MAPQPRYKTIGTLICAGMFAATAAFSQLVGHYREKSDVVDIPEAVVGATDVSVGATEAGTIRMKIEAELGGYGDNTFVFRPENMGSYIEQGDTVRNVHARKGALSDKYRVTSFDI